MREGTVVAWRVQPLEQVEKGQVILVIESEKTEAEIEAPATGVLRHIYIEPGETMPCETLLAVITPSAEEPFDVEAHRARARPAPLAQPTAAPRAPVSSTPSPGARAPGRPVTPAARKRAQELGLELARVQGSGPGGRVTREDVDAVAVALGARVTVADAVALEVESQGEGTPVVLLPGFGTDASAFARQLPVLAEQYRALAVNPRGVGLSDAPEAESYEVATSAEDAGKLLGAAGHVVGASLGAAAALELALAQPQRVLSLSLITPFVCVSVRLARVVEAWCAIANAAPPPVLAQALLPWLFSENFLSDPVLRARAANGLSQSLQKVPPATLARQARGLESWDGTRAADLGRITVPTLVLAAGADLLTPDAVEIAAAIPGAKLTVVEGAGHAVTLEAAHEINAALLEHLQAVDGRG